MENTNKEFNNTPLINTLNNIYTDASILPVSESWISLKYLIDTLAFLIVVTSFLITFVMICYFTLMSSAELGIISRETAEYYGNIHSATSIYICILFILVLFLYLMVRWTFMKWVATFIFCYVVCPFCIYYSYRLIQNYGTVRNN